MAAAVLSNVTNMAMTTMSAMNHTGMDTMGMNHTMTGNMTGMNHTGMDMGGMNHTGMGMGGMDMGGMDMGGMGMGAMDGMMMMMYFHARTMEYFLFEELMTKTAGAFAGGCIVVFVLGVLYELLKFWREKLQQDYIMQMSHIQSKGTMEEKARVTSVVSRMLSGPHILQTLLHAVQIFLSYCLMLLFMTYNVYIALCVVLGAAAGYFLVGWKRTQIVDGTEHCH